MNALASQCSSGCESGWTLYLEHSFQLNHNASSHTSSQFIGEDNGFCDEDKDKKAKKEEAEEEDLSMVSDASSGPPHLPDAQDNGSFHSASKAAKLGKRSKKRQKVKENQHLPSFLDDTASSPIFDFPMVSLTFLAINCIVLLIFLGLKDDTHLALDNFSEQCHCDQPTNFDREHARLLPWFLCYLL